MESDSQCSGIPYVGPFLCEHLLPLCLTRFIHVPHAARHMGPHRKAQNFIAVDLVLSSVAFIVPVIRKIITPTLIEETETARILSSGYDIGYCSWLRSLPRADKIHIP